MSQKRRWYRLDNAALIFPAVHRRTWANMFRFSFTFVDPIDPAILQMAVDNMQKRFPSCFVRLRQGAFWYYLEEVDPPRVHEDSYQPLMHMKWEEVRKCMMRVRYYRDRMAVEFFHSVTDGTGGMIFAKNLAAEYVRLRYNEEVPVGDHDLKDLTIPAMKEELEDSFQKYAGKVSAPRDDRDVFRPRGEREDYGFMHVTLGTVDTEDIRKLAKAAGVTVTGYLTAMLLECLLEMQQERVPNIKKRKKVKVQIPVNLRKFFDSVSQRNFVSLINVGVDPKLGDYSFEELLFQVNHQMKLGLTQKNLQAIFTPNVTSEKNPIIRIVPLFIKNLVMRLVFDMVGENVSCLSFSNLGHIDLPEVMNPYLKRAEFVLAAPASAAYNVSLSSINGKSFINIVRNTKEPELERSFFTKLVKKGVHVLVESNGDPVKDET